MSSNTEELNVRNSARALVADLRARASKAEADANDYRFQFQALYEEAATWTTAADLIQNRLLAPDAVADVEALGLPLESTT